MHAMLTDITSRESSWWFEAGFVVHVHVRACVHVRCCFTSTETERTTRDGEPRTFTSTFTQLLSSVSVSSHCSWTRITSMHAMLTDIASRESSRWFEAGFVAHVYVRAFMFGVALRPRRLSGLLGTGSPGRPPPLSQRSA